MFNIFLSSQVIILCQEKRCRVSKSYERLKLISKCMWDHSIMYNMKPSNKSGSDRLHLQRSLDNIRKVENEISCQNVIIYVIKKEQVNVDKIIFRL